MPTSPASVPPRRIACLDVARIQLPPVVARLYDLAYNLWWAWNPRAVELFRSIDAAGWELYQNPVQLLLNVEPGAWTPLLRSPAFRADYERVVGELDGYLAALGGTWFSSPEAPRLPGPIAYLSTEFGLHHSLAVYSGGLGVLSGDHLKTASDLGLPMVGVGLMYRQGYFRQTLDADGRQQHVYPSYDATRLPMRLAADAQGGPLEVTVPMPGRDVALRVWVAQVGRIPLLLLDSEVTRNAPSDRVITNQLYVQGREMRLVQEMVLGVGAARALAALKIAPGVWHVNEGHSAMVQLARLETLRRAGLDWPSAVAEAATDVVFTTHTPVPAGNEQFDAALARKYLEPWSERLDTPVDDVLALGQVDAGADAAFNLTALGLRTARAANAVSVRNAEVVQTMWRSLSGNDRRVPRIEPVTNGVHVPTWIGPEVAELFERRVGADWRERLLDEAAWERILEASDDEVWGAHTAQKERLGRFVAQRLLEQYARHGRSPDDLRRVDRLFDPHALTIGFARRFATYKRAHLLFDDMDRLRTLLERPATPVQILLAGKAHPADRAGQDLIQRLFELGQSDELKGRLFFVEDYDILVGQRLVQGVDVWLNTPRPPLEASGTSGMKAAINGALNLSVADGWWLEGYDGANGWSIDAGADAGDEDEQDRLDRDQLYGILEDEVLPAWSDRDNGLPHAWIARMKRAMATVTPRFSSHRMLRDYAERLYAEPAPDGAAEAERFPPGVDSS